MNGWCPGAAAAGRAAAGSVLYRRRCALGLSLLDLNHQTGLPLLLLADLERGRAAALEGDSFARVVRALGFAGPCEVLWRLASGLPAERPGARRATTAGAVQRFLQVVRAADLGVLVR